jgi:hypothetical protein
VRDAGPRPRPALWGWRGNHGWRSGRRGRGRARCYDRRWVWHTARCRRAWESRGHWSGSPFGHGRRPRLFGALRRRVGRGCCRRGEPDGGSHDGQRRDGQAARPELNHQRTVARSGR